MTTINGGEWIKPRARVQYNQSAKSRSERATVNFVSFIIRDAHLSYPKNADLMTTMPPPIPQQKGVFTP